MSPSIVRILTVDECKKALFSLSLGKTPGSDGLTGDFYRAFWSKIGDLVTASLNQAFYSSTLSAEQGRAVITLIPKPGKDPHMLKNYRPISLLNTDYKICSKALASRIQPILPKIISSNQTGFIKGRFIGENIRLVLDLIDFCSSNFKKGMLFLIDFEKAFDRVDWNFIVKSLEFFNFGEDFIRWTSTLYSNNTGRVLNNGFSCAAFNITRGVRQGCPLSPYLFIICAEVLSIFVNGNPSIKGISLFGDEIKIMQYADDTTLFLDGTYDSLREAVSALDIYQQASGLKIN